MGSDAEMRQQLMPLAPQMVRSNYADMVLLIAMACDTPLIQDIQEVNECTTLGLKQSGVWHQGPMGFWPWAVRQDVNFVWSTRPEQKKESGEVASGDDREGVRRSRHPHPEQRAECHDRDNYNDYLRGTTGTAS